MEEKDNAEIAEEQASAVFKSSPRLLALNTLARILPAATAVMLGYFVLSLPVKSLRTDPVALFLTYWPYWLLLILLLAALWTLWFDLVTIYAYKTKMLICKHKKRWVIYYNAIITFTYERSFMVFIPMAMQKKIVAAGSGRINKVKSCSCLSKEDYFYLHHICNADRPAGCEIPMDRSTYIGTREIK